MGGNSKRTEDGLLIQEGSPYKNSCHLVWGSVLWDSGLALARFFTWNENQLGGGVMSSVRSRSILELGAGTGVVGLTLAKLGAEVTLTDFETEVLELIRRNAAANDLTSAIHIRELDWAKPATFLKSKSFDLIVAADVLYSRRDRMFTKALIAHMVAGASSTAIVASPPREDSPLPGFFDLVLGAGLCLERLEDGNGAAARSGSGSPGTSALDGSRFVALTAHTCRSIAHDAHGNVHIFRITRQP